MFSGGIHSRIMCLRDIVHLRNGAICHLLQSYAEIVPPVEKAVPARADRSQAKDWPPKGAGRHTLQGPLPSESEMRPELLPPCLVSKRTPRPSPAGFLRSYAIFASWCVWLVSLQVNLISTPYSYRQYVRKVFLNFQPSNSAKLQIGMYEF